MKLFLDMDDTLLKAEFEKKRRIFYKPDFSVEIGLNNKKQKEIVNVYKRPDLDYFLENVSEMCKVSIFTSSLPLYAIPILREIDPERQFKRLYRNDTVPYNGYPHVKSLNNLGCDLSQTVIVDDNPIAMCTDPDNAILIKRYHPFHGIDEELYALIKIIEDLSELTDVRPYLRNKFGFRKQVEANNLN